jgi:Mannosylglycerate hydrolase MGH1-like glycoside hydrolase domain
MDRVPLFSQWRALQDESEGIAMSEKQRLIEMNNGTVKWRHWGPYLSERQWGTVREDYSAGGIGWDYLPHDHARSRAYRWGEDGIAGFCDEDEFLCFALAVWNGKDPILKERLFGLNNQEGNHGEDVKELYYYLDATPTHSYLKMLYKYPQREFPYTALLQENRRRGKQDLEYELIDTGIFDDDRYFDLFVEYAKAGPDDILIQITVANRGPEAAIIHLLPQLWFRNIWSWSKARAKPALEAVDPQTISAKHAQLGSYLLQVEGSPSLLFCENETNFERLFSMPNPSPYCKDAFHEWLIRKNGNAVNPLQTGTKSAAHYQLVVGSGAEQLVRMRLSSEALAVGFANFEEILIARREEADAFYGDLQRDIVDPDLRLIQRQAFAGIIWSKQRYRYEVRTWLDGDPSQPAPPGERKNGRNQDWRHLNTTEVLSMPDKWEYPWFAAWDLAFHTLPFAVIDPEFAKEQLVVITREWYMHPNGQLPAYEWAFGDVNPPVHAWAAWRVFQIDRKQRRMENPNDPGDLPFLERVFHKLLLNFTWWVNRKDVAGRNIFQGGFLGLDNIGVFDRSAPLPTGGYINQSDGTSWMAMYSLNLMRIALELAQRNHVYEDIASKFFEHFLQIANAMAECACGIGLWNDEDGFYYDVLNLPSGQMIPMRVRSIVGLIPLFAVETLEPELLKQVPAFKNRLEWLLNHRPDLAALISRWHTIGSGDRRLLSLLRGHRMKLLLKRMLDETEFLSDHGIRALSRYHRDHPYCFQWNGSSTCVDYEPGESSSGVFGGNSNWRGPIWFPMNFLLIESLERFHHYYGDDFRIECPTGSGKFCSIKEVAAELRNRLCRLFLRDSNGRRPVFGENSKLQSDPHFRDYLQFFEYFHGDTGLGVGASHQTGWTGLIAKLIASSLT